MTRSVTAVGVPQSTAQHLRFLGKYVFHLKDEKIWALYNALTEPMPSPCQILYSTQSAGHRVTAGGSHWQLCYLLNNNGEFYLGNIAHLKSRIPWNALKVLFHPFKLYQFGKFASRRMWISVSFTTSQSPHFPILHFFRICYITSHFLWKGISEMFLAVSITEYLSLIHTDSTVKITSQKVCSTVHSCKDPSHKKS